MSLLTPLPAGVTVRNADDADWPAMKLLAATCFGSFWAPEVTDMWRSMIPGEGAVVVCDGSQIVGMSMYLDLRLTVPGGTVLPAAGVTWVAVSPTHRRRGILRAMLDELHRRMARSEYPIAALLASEGGIYGRFGYGPATIEQQLRVQRRWRSSIQRFPTPAASKSSAQPCTPPAVWDEVLADRESARSGGSPFFGLLHADGYAMYRVYEATDSVEVTRFAAVSADAHVALWRVLLGLDLIDTITVHTHPADPLHYLLTDARRVETTSSRDALWLRIIDIPATLQARTYEADLSVVMEISDTALGKATFALTIRDGKAQVAPTDSAPDLHVDVSVLGSIYLGAHRPSAFATANRLRCNDAHLLRQLDLAFASQVPAKLGFDF